jgi:hypothetical protein
MRLAAYPAAFIPAMQMLNVLYRKAYVIIGAEIKFVT